MFIVIAAFEYNLRNDFDIFEYEIKLIHNVDQWVIGCKGTEGTEEQPFEQDTE